MEGLEYDYLRERVRRLWGWGGGKSKDFLFLLKVGFLVRLERILKLLGLFFCFVIC